MSPVHSSSARIMLVAEPIAAPCSRMFVTYTLCRWHIEALIDDAELIVTELISSAVRQKAPRTSLVLPWPLPRGIVVQLRRHGASLFVEVADQAAALPSLRVPGTFDEHGREIPLVATVSQDWGAWVFGNNTRIVWAELPLPGTTETDPHYLSGPAWPTTGEPWGGKGRGGSATDQ